MIIPGEHLNHLNVQLKLRDDRLQNINETHRSYDPLSYVIMFPHGEDGFHLGLGHFGKTSNVTISEFARYRLQVRSKNFNQVLRCQRLTQQYTCDQQAKIESARLRYVKSHQKELRAEKYQGLMDAVEHDELLNAGQKIVLPPTIYGSPRWYQSAYQDAMAIVRSYGKPDIFLTFTCNPAWPEIFNSVFDNESSSDRPDINVRVFKLKLDALMKDIKGSIFGKVNAYFGMKEDQKRGLP